MQIFSHIKSLENNNSSRKTCKSDVQMFLRIT